MGTHSNLRQFIFLNLICAGTIGSAQTPAAMDSIFFTTGKYVVGRVDEIGLDEIKYRGENDEIRFAVDKESVARIRLGSGEVVTVKKDGFSVGFRPEVLKKTHAIEFEVLSFALDHVTMSYEQVLKPWVNLEIRTTYIGAGNPNMLEECMGFTLAGGVKFINRPDHITRGMKLGHPLHGRYVRPELLFSTFTSKSRFDMGAIFTSKPIVDQIPIHYTNVAFNVILGKQRFLGDGVTLDTWVGVGYAFQSVNSEAPWLEETRTFNYNYVLWSETVPIAMSAGLSLGLAF